MRKAECAICGWIGEAGNMRGMDRAQELFDKGVIRSRETTPWVFCRACRCHFENNRDMRE